MKCPECQKEGKKSKVYIGHTSTTYLMVQQFYDEEGNYHLHNPNKTTTNYSCSNGHQWAESSSFKCPICDFESEVK